MTEEQIKQNAEVYANTIRIGNLCYSPELIAMVSFEDGAHSRDEEIEEIQNELESLRKGFYERGDKLKELMLKNNELRNPWISVKDRFPEEGDEIILKRDYVSSYFRKVRVEDIRFIEYSEPNAKWMLIPKIQKGE